MTSAKKLDVFEIVDEFGTSEETLLKHAMEGAQDFADANGWREISVKRSTKDPIREGKALRHFFDIFGVGENSMDLDSENEKSAIAEAPYRRAAKESTL